MLIIDGSIGEGGGQVLRTSLALSICRQRPFRIVDIRARRPNPGLRPQHLAAVHAAAAICNARVDGAAIGAQALTFAPGRVEPGKYRFAIGTAGSTNLLLQTVLPALLTVETPTDLQLEGETHNPRAPTFECLARAYLPLIERMGPRVAFRLERHGFEPAGGGLVRVHIEPARRLDPLRIEKRGALTRLEGEVLLSKLPAHIAGRETAVLTTMLGLRAEDITQRIVSDSPGAGNVVTVAAVCEDLTEVFVGFGRRGVPAEKVAQTVARAATDYLAGGAPIGVHLADQLLLPLAIAGSGSFATSPPSPHTLTNIRVIREFLPLDIRCTATTDPEIWRIEVVER